MQDKQKVVEMLKDLQGSSIVEINDLKNVIKFNDGWGKPNIYFITGLGQKKATRCSDDDITYKCYIPVDIDIRLDWYSKTGQVLSEWELDELIQKILTKLDANDMASKYRYAVNSGNGLHLYYVGDEIKPDKDGYSKGVAGYQIVINEILKEWGLSCDPAVKNVGRIMRMPWTINPRKKVKGGQVLRDLGNYTCNIIKFKDIKIDLTDTLKTFGELYDFMVESEKAQLAKDEPVITQAIKTIKPSDNVRADINALDVWDIAEQVRGIRKGHNYGDKIALKDTDGNIGAYVYTPNNVIVNTGSSRIKASQRKTFTPFELVLYELCNGDKKDALNWFKQHYNIVVSEQAIKHVKVEIPEDDNKLTNRGYIFPWDIFNEFGCFMSGELVTIVAESNSGKTTFALDIVRANVEKYKAKKDNCKAFYINLEFDIKTMRQSRRLWSNGYKKINLTCLEALPANKQKEMDKRVDEQLSKFAYWNKPDGVGLNELLEKILEKKAEGYELFIVDTFSRIGDNMDGDKWYSSQNETIATLQELVQKTGVAMVLLHHTNKKKEFAGSQKIMDLSTMFISIEKTDEPSVRIFKLVKDKYTPLTNLCIEYNPANWEYKEF